MPVRGSNLVIDEEAERRKALILKKIHVANQNASQNQRLNEADSNSISGSLEDVCPPDSIKSYKLNINQTLDLPIEKLVMTPEGCDIFNELCLRLDVNQKYADILPQWKDVAHHLQMDDLTTKWVEVCVRPREGLTRAMLEIYMKDGGTLGEVLESLLELECLDILEEMKPKIDLYIKKKDNGELVPKTNFVQGEGNEAFFSLLKTLMSAMGNQDPCQDLYKFANGLKSFKAMDSKNLSEPIVSDEIREHAVVVQSAAEVLNNDWPKYVSHLHLNDLDDEEDLLSSKKLGAVSTFSCKILLLFAEDGVAASEEAIAISRTIDHEDCRVELFRLNEATLWYEVLVNPEACCMKWASEADYIMPILTPKFLHEIHGQYSGSAEEYSGLLPTSPVLNKYMYNLARSQYTQNGCKNLKVRPLVPINCLGPVTNSNAVKMDPLLAHTWKALKEDAVKSRLRAMMNECVKKRRSA